MSVSPLNPKPLYQQVKNHILERIDSKEWPPDTKVPSELELTRMFKVSRMTVNRALRELTTSGHLTRLQGVGTYVAHPRPMKVFFEIHSIDDEIIAQGGAYSCDIILQAEEQAYPELAEAMELRVGSPVYHSVTVHRKDKQPVMLADRYVNPLSAPEFLQQDFSTITPARYLLNSITFTDIEHIIEAIAPDAVTQRLLEVAPHEPCLLLHRQTWEGKRIATHSRFTYPGARYSIGGRFKPLKTGYKGGNKRTTGAVG